MRLNIVDKPPVNVCHYVATYVNEERPGELFRSSGGELDLTNDGSEERVEIGAEGSAGNPYISLYDKKTGGPIDIRWAAQDSKEWWGDDISLVLYKDGYYILYSAYGWYPIVLTQLNPSNYERVICQFETVVEEVVGEKCEDKALCELLLTKQRPSYLQFTESHQLEPGKLHLSETGAGRALAIDVDNDGKEEPIIELQYASLAGPGCAYNFFDKLNEDRNGLVDDKTHELLVAMQGLSSKHSRDPVPHCLGNTTGWFRFNGITYYETKFHGERPVSAAGEFHEVSYIKDSQVHKVCQYDFKKKVEIKVCLDCELSEKKPAAKRGQATFPEKSSQSP
ncbi:MAG: hypothetical protein DMG11_32135 [Acidobacteria bacterium]|nr:MAG: hypothetical protein DMG11_32135 [Acidobacteriota bacterium]